MTIPMLAVLAVLAASCEKELPNTNYTDGSLYGKLAGGEGGEIIPGNILIKLDAATTAAIEEGKFEDVRGEILDGIEVTSFMPAIPARPKNREVAERYGLNRWFSIDFDEDIKPQEVARKLSRSPRVRTIQYNKKTGMTRPEASFALEPAAMTRSAQKVQPTHFNDPHSIWQWNLANDGSISDNAVPGADIGVKDAWKLTGGDPSVIVAVIDDAIDYDHEDLMDAMWRNEKEISGEKGIDDDGNGFIDDKYGFNFVSCWSFTENSVNNKIYNGEKFQAVSNDGLSPAKGSGHGTHVGGIIGATNNNGKGVSSIAGGTGAGDGVRLMSLQISRGTFAGDPQKAAAFIYAADNGACIAQCSYGSGTIFTDDEKYIDENPLEYAALQYFLDPDNSNHSNLKGNVAIFASSNYSEPYSSYPGAYSEVISVTAIGCDFLPGGYTNYGPGCNIAAPGGEYKGIEGDYCTMILSTGTPLAKGSGTGLEVTVNGTTKRSEDYVYMYGTSMACPHVSGVAALGLSYAHKIGKVFTREEFTSLLLTSVNDIDRFLMSGTKKFFDIPTNSFTELPLQNYYGKMGTGALDAWKFLMAIEGTPTVVTTPGSVCSIRLADYVGDTAGRLDYKVSVDAESRESLGIDGEIEITSGIVEFTCTRLGAGKLTFTSDIGKDTGMDNGIGAMPLSREISIVCRTSATANGGWL